MVTFPIETTVQVLTQKHKNNSERPLDALAFILEKGESLTRSLTHNLKSRDASASKKQQNHRGSELVDLKQRTCIGKIFHWEFCAGTSSCDGDRRKCLSSKEGETLH